MKLLLAEDTQDLNRAVTALLRHQEYEVDSAFDGEEALEYIKRDCYDGIILDIMMPKKDGLEVLKELRSRHILTPVLLLTAKAEVDDRVAGLDAGADDYLPKPFAMKELLARIRAMTRRSSTYSEGDLTTEYLLSHVWKHEPEAQEDTVWLYISYLKGKLRSIGSPVTISGIRGGSFGLRRES